MSEDLTVQCRCGNRYNLVESEDCPACHTRPGRSAVIALTAEEAGILALLASEAGDRQEAAGHTDAAELRHSLARRLFQVAAPETAVSPGDSTSVVIDSRGRACRVEPVNRPCVRLDDGIVVWPDMSDPYWTAGTPLDVQYLAPIEAP